MSYELKHSTSRNITAGHDYPLGATLLGDGVNFAIYSQNADEVFLLLFDRPDGDPTDIIRMEEKTRNIRHVFVQGIKAGQLYGYKARGRWEPANGLRFNENKLLLDPYARALTGKLVNKSNLLLAYDPASPDKDLFMDTRDNTQVVPKCIVVDDRFDWQGDEPLRIDPEKTVIYEVHVKGFTAHPSSGVKNPGTYLGFIEKIPYLKSLGVNAVELLPVHEFYVDDSLKERGLTNYWGYMTAAFFAPESSYGTGKSPGCQVDEFKTLVRELHKAGIEVILDVVYNHTGESKELGPTFSLRGIDNPAYYWLTGPGEAPARYYMDHTGCGNTLDFGSPATIRLVMDSLRYWVEVMHVDGFRFDLAAVLGEDRGGFLRTASFFAAVSQDPVLCHAKLIAEPWDTGSVDAGMFPVDWSEWNGRFRDTVRRFVKSDSGQLPDLGRRLTGSADLYGDNGRTAYNSINFVACHDGFTLYDLVSYNGKHNDANGESNSDGSNDNNSWNCGAEGATDDQGVLELRRRQVKNFLCLTLFSSGTPMVLGGDEFMRTQGGNNNCYCQDNETSWFDWDLVKKNSDMVEFFKKAVALTRRYTILQRRKFMLGKDNDSDHLPDISWFGADLGRPHWNDPECRTLCCLLDGGEERSEAGDYQLYLMLNADFNAERVGIPDPPGGRRWHRVVDTSLPAGQDFMDTGSEALINPPDYYIVNPRSVVVLITK